MIEVLINIRIPELWVTPITEKYDIKIACQIGGQYEKGGWGLVTIEGDDETLNEVLNEIRRHPSVGGVEIKTRHPDSVTFIVDVVQCKGCNVLMQSKAFIVFPVEISNGRMKWLLITDNNKTMGLLIDRLDGYGYDVILERVTSLGDKGILTNRQEEIIRIAFELGYFDFPRRTDSQSLASKIGISISTLSEVMRAAQRRIVAEYLHA